jgi:WD40 repeat protein
MPPLNRLDIKTNEVYVCSFLADSTRALIGAEGNPVQLWDIASCRLVRDFGDQSVGSWAVGWTEQQQVLIGARDGTVLIADAESGRELHNFRGHRYYVRALDAKHETLISASGASDGEVLLWVCGAGRARESWRGTATGCTRLR